MTLSSKYLIINHQTDYNLIGWKNTTHYFTE
nr:MAG TPA: hypothetical protein [Caudoviricetes sp.]